MPFVILWTGLSALVIIFNHGAHGSNKKKVTTYANTKITVVDF